MYIRLELRIWYPWVLHGAVKINLFVSEVPATTSPSELHHDHEQSLEVQRLNQNQESRL
jgi:hypothetical protein